MIKHIWSVLSAESTVNEDTKLISIRDVVETLNVSLTPAPGANPKLEEDPANIPISYEVTSFFYRDDTNKEEKVEIEIIGMSPTGKEATIKSHGEFVMTPGMKRMRNRAKFVGLNINSNGDYWFSVSVRLEGQKLFKVVAELPLEVIVKIEKDSPQK